MNGLAISIKPVFSAIQPDSLGYAGPFPLLVKEELEEGIILIVNLGLGVNFKCSS